MLTVLQVYDSSDQGTTQRVWHSLRSKPERLYETHVEQRKAPRKANTNPKPKPKSNAPVSLAYTVWMRSSDTLFQVSSVLP